MADARHVAISSIEYFAVEGDPDMGMSLGAVDKYAEQEDRAGAARAFHDDLSTT